ncbi:hypothetical protein ACP70R_046354 [Stipagrostis hirtigluma subsp. patula]
MAEMVGSVVVGEVVNRTSSFLIDRHRERLGTREGIERLEMAHIKMEAALEVSGRWRHATEVPLLRWRRKLRRAADECDAVLHRWKLRALVEEEARERLARAPLPWRVARAVVSFVSALLALARGDDELSRASAAVQRFERLANGAAEFLRCVESSSAPRQRIVLDRRVVGKLGDDVNCGGLLQGARRRCLGGAGSSKSPAQNWVEIKPCRRGLRAPGKKKLLLV